ncbi:MAG: hypothetical protein ACLFQ9_09580, partial [Desulfobacterales bacterium]
MKLAREDIIKACEKHLIKLIVKNIDRSALKQAIREKCDIAPGSDISFYSGNMVTRNGRIAYRLDFSVQANLSVLLDRTGEALEITASEKLPEEGEPEAEESTEEGGRRIASEIAQMISEINE